MSNLFYHIKQVCSGLSSFKSENIFVSKNASSLTRTNFMCEFWVTEVRSKILTPLETTGGNSFSLEGFEKILFTIQNFTQGDLHSTGGIQMSFLGVYNSTGGIQLSFLWV